MFQAQSFRMAALAGAGAALAGMLVPALALAQPGPPPGYYDDQDQAYYDACQHQKSGDTAAGAILGGALGAAIGAGVAGHGNRAAGAIVGAGVGGVSGAAVGSSQVDCNAPPPPPPPAYGNGYGGPPPGYYQNGYYQGDQGGDYDQGPGYQGGPPPGPGYQGGPPSGYYDQGDQDYDQGGPGYQGGPPPPQPGADCTYAQSPIYMPDGSVQHRTVQVCRDANGQYQPAD